MRIRMRNHRDPPVRHARTAPVDDVSAVTNAVAAIADPYGMAALPNSANLSVFTRYSNSVHVLYDDYSGTSTTFLFRDHNIGQRVPTADRRPGGISCLLSI